MQGVVPPQAAGGWAWGCVDAGDEEGCEVVDRVQGGCVDLAVGGMPRGMAHSVPTKVARSFQTFAALMFPLLSGIEVPAVTCEQVPCAMTLSRKVATPFALTFPVPRSVNPPVSVLLLR